MCFCDVEAEKRVQVWCTGSSNPWNLGMPPNEEAPPCDPKSNNLMQKERSKVISILVDMETEDSLERHAIMVIDKKLAWQMQTYSTIKLKIFFFPLCTPMVLIYNSELAIIFSSELFHKETLEEALFTPEYFYSIFLQGVVGGYHMKYLGNLFLYSSIDCISEIACPTLVQNPCNLHGLRLKNHQSQKKLLQVLRTRGSIFYDTTGARNSEILPYIFEVQTVQWTDIMSIKFIDSRMIYLLYIYSMPPDALIEPRKLLGT